MGHLHQDELLNWFNDEVGPLPMVTSLVEARAVSYFFRGRPALCSVSFAIDEGVTGLLGPNGAGKSTLMALAATLRKPSQGVMLIDGLETVKYPRDICRRIGYLPQRFSVLKRSSAMANLEYAAWTHGLEGKQIPVAVEETLKAVDLWDRRHDYAGSFSGGMRQRLGIGCATVHRPRVVLLDEPTVGLDPVQRVAVRRLIDELSSSAAVLVSTHLLEDLAALTSRAIVLDHGNLRFAGDLSEIERRGVASPSQGLSLLEAGYVDILQDSGVLV